MHGASCCIMFLLGSEGPNAFLYLVDLALLISALDGDCQLHTPATLPSIKSPPPLYRLEVG
jgi:hypothetical protein